VGIVLRLALGVLPSCATGGTTSVVFKLKDAAERAAVPVATI
jgi:hypothetical protein